MRIVERLRDLFGRHGIGPRRRRIVSRTMLCSSRRSSLGYDYRRCHRSIWIHRQRPPLDFVVDAPILLLQLICHRRDCLRFIRLLSRVVVCQLDSDLARVFSFAVQLLPKIVLSSSRHHHVRQADPSLADEVRSFVLAEHRNLEVVVIRRIVHGEANLLIPAEAIKSVSISRWISNDLQLTISAFVHLSCPSPSFALPCPIVPQHTDSAFP